MNRTKKLLMTLMAAVVLGLGATAQAQDSPPPAPPPASSSSGSVSLGGGAGIGVGAALTLSQVPTAQFVYDAAVFHIEGLLGFASISNMGGNHTTQVGFGAGGWYHLHRGSASDFSLGAAIVVATTSPPVGNSTTVTAFEPGAQIRAFVTPNVSLNARVGLAFLFGDTGGGGTDIFFNGQGSAVGGAAIGPTGALGITYFFR